MAQEIWYSKYIYLYIYLSTHNNSLIVTFLFQQSENVLKFIFFFIF